MVLSTALEARSDAPDVARMFSISVGKEGFFTERHPKLDPVATMNDGIFVAGCAQGPKDIPDSVAQASAAAMRASALLSVGSVTLEPITAFVDEDRCAGCRICNLLCPYQAIAFDEEKKVSRINESLCKGCGTCVAACPVGAAQGRHFTEEQVLAEIEGALT